MILPATSARFVMDTIETVTGHGGVAFVGSLESESLFSLSWLVPKPGVHSTSESVRRSEARGVNGDPS